MSKAQDICRSVRVFNDYDFFGDKPHIWKVVADGRIVSLSKWVVSKCGEKLLDMWYDYGDKTFSYISREDSKEAFEKAKAYLRERWEIKEVKRSPFGGYGDAEYVKNRLKEIKQLAKEGKEVPDD